MVVPLVLPSTNARTLQRLVVGEGGQNAKNDWNARVQLDPHETMRHTVTNVLKVHGCTLDENTDGDDCIKRSCRQLGTRRGVVGNGTEAKQIGTGRAWLYAGTCNDSTQRSLYRVVECNTTHLEHARGSS